VVDPLSEFPGPRQERKSHRFDVALKGRVVLRRVALRGALL
jgi:hypothetical protein